MSLNTFEYLILKQILENQLNIMLTLKANNPYRQNSKIAQCITDTAKIQQGLEPLGVLDRFASESSP